MKCEVIRENLVAFLYGELNRDETMAIHEHLSRCESCASEEIELRQTLRQVNHYHLVDLPAHFEQQLDLKLNPTSKAKPSAKFKYRRIIWAVAATLILTLALEFLAYQFLLAPVPAVTLANLETRESIFESSKPKTAAQTPWKERVFQKFRERFDDDFVETEN